MRVFVFTTRLSGGGAERVGVVLANGLASHGHEVYMASNKHLDVVYPIDDVVHIINIFPKTKNKLRKWIVAVVKLRKVVKNHRPDVIIGIEETCSLIAKIACIGKHSHVICTEHNSYQRPPSAPMGKVEWFMKYQMTKIYECVTVLTNADREYIGNRLGNVVVMPNPLAIEPLQQIPEKKKVVLAAGRLDVWHTKGFDLLIRAWARVVSSSKNQVSSSTVSGSKFQVPNIKECQVSKELEPGTTETCNLKSETCNLKPADDLQESTPWRLQIAGKYDFVKSFDYLKGLCKEYGVEDSVDFLGFRTDLEELYKQSEIFVLSSRFEGFGLVLIEAMSQGCACVACDYKGRQREIICPDGANESFKFQESSSNTSTFKNQDSKELECGAIDNCNLKPETHLQPVANLKPETTPLRGLEVCENGVLCEPENVEALALSIKKMMEDEEYRKKVQRNSVERSKAYRVDRTIQRWEELLNQIVK